MDRCYAKYRLVLAICIDYMIKLNLSYSNYLFYDLWKVDTAQHQQTIN